MTKTNEHNNSGIRDNRTRGKVADFLTEKIPTASPELLAVILREGKV